MSVTEPGSSVTGGAGVESVGGSTFANYVVLDLDEDEANIVATTSGLPVTQSVLVVTTSGGSAVLVVRDAPTVLPCCRCSSLSFGSCSVAALTKLSTKARNTYYLCVPRTVIATNSAKSAATCCSQNNGGGSAMACTIDCTSGSDGTPDNGQLMWVVNKVPQMRCSVRAAVG